MSDEVTIKRVLILGAIALAVLGSGVSACMFGGPAYHVWNQGMAGRAEYARAEANRQIAALDGQALEETARAEANRDVIRATGEAEANLRIGASLEGEHGRRRLQYLQIEAMREHEGAVIYIPTEAGLPITEAGRLRGRIEE